MWPLFSLRFSKRWIFRKKALNYFHPFKSKRLLLVLATVRPFKCQVIYLKYHRPLKAKGWVVLCLTHFSWELMMSTYYDVIKIVVHFTSAVSSPHIIMIRLFWVFRVLQDWVPRVVICQEKHFFRMKVVINMLNPTPSIFGISPPNLR